MEKIFNTKRFFKSHSIEMTNNGLKVYKKSLFDYHEYEIPFEELENHKTVTSLVNNGPLVIAFFFIVIGILFISFDNIEPFLYSFLIAIILIAFALSTKRKVISIGGMQQKIELFYSNSNEQEVRDFADEIINASNNYLLKKYGKVDRDLPFENQFNNLEFLKNRDIITEEEFQELKNQLLGKENKSIGYSK